MMADSRLLSLSMTQSHVLIYTHNTHKHTLSECVSELVSGQERARERERVREKDHADNSWTKTQFRAKAHMTIGWQTATATATATDQDEDYLVCSNGWASEWKWKWEINKKQHATENNIPMERPREWKRARIKLTETEKKPKQQQQQTKRKFSNRIIYKFYRHWCRYLSFIIYPPQIKCPFYWSPSNITIVYFVSTVYTHIIHNTRRLGCFNII